MMRFNFRILILFPLLLGLLPTRLAAGEKAQKPIYSRYEFNTFPNAPEDIFASDFTPSETLNFTGGDQYIAIRQSFQNPHDRQTTFILLHYALIEDLRILIRHQSGKILSKRSGIDTKISEREFNDRDYAFSFTLAPNERVDIISIAKSSLAFNLRPSIILKELYLTQYAESSLHFGLYIGAVLFIAFVSLVLYWNTRESIFLYYFTTVIFTHLLGTLTPFGLINRYVFAENPELALKSVTVILCLTVITSMLFCQHLLGTRKKIPALHQAINLVLWVSGVLIIATLISQNFIVSAIADGLSAIAMLMALVAALLSVRENRAAKYYLIGWILFFASAATFLLQDNGIIEANDLTRHALIFGSLFECLFFIQAIAEGLLKVKSELDRRGDALSTLLKNDFDESLLSLESGNRIRQTKELYLSIMFIDTVEFSTTMNMHQDDPVNIVDQLGENFFRVRKIIRENQGIIVNTGGDSVFALFGFGLTEEELYIDHPLSALTCARQIRTMCLDHIDKASEAKQAIFPLRIGLHVGDVIIKDLGDERFADITGLGADVNYASRIEQASNPLEILVSEAFREALLRIDSQSRFHKKCIKIKHIKNLAVAWELETKSNPEEAARHDLAIRKIHEYFKRKRSDGRIDIRDLGLKAETDLGVFKIIDLSSFGFLFESKDFYPAVDITIQIKDLLNHDNASVLDPILQDMREHHLTVAIKWSKLVKDVFHFGVELQQDSEVKSRVLTEILPSLAKRLKELPADGDRKPF